MRLLTIGFKGKSAEAFFSALRSAGVEKVIDVRRTSSSQLMGFTKERDLAFFLGLVGIGYEHVADLAPSEEVLKEYRARLGHKKKDDTGWQVYVERYSAELAAKPVRERFLGAVGGLSCVCLLCSEDLPERCHRRLLAEHLAKLVPGVEVAHL